MSKKIEKKSNTAKDDAELDEEENLDDEDADESEEEDTDTDEDESSDEEDEDEDSDEGDSDDDDSKDDDKKIDWKAKAEEERKARKKAEDALAGKRFKKSEKKRKSEDEDEGDEDEDDEDRPITKRDLRDILSQNNRESNVGQIKKIAKELTDDPDKAEYLIEIHAGRTFPTGMPLEEQLEEALAIVDRKHNDAKTSELRRALRSKNTSSRDAGGSHRSGQEGFKPKIEKSLEASLKAAGFKFNPTMRIFRKKLPSGKYLNKDTRTKPVKTWVSA